MRSTRCVVIAGLAGLGLSVSALGDIVGNPLTLVATAQDGRTATVQVTLDECQYDPVSHLWWFSSTEPRPLIAADQSVLGSLDSLNFTYIGDPVITLNFAVASNNTPVSFTFSSALLTFAPIVNPAANSSAGISLTDSDGTGAVLIGNHAAHAYRADYNGQVPTGTLYSLHAPSTVAGPFGTTFTGGSNNAPIVGVVSSMSAQFSFELGTFDQAAGTSVFNIVPAPGAAALLGLGGLLVARRRR